MYANVSKNTLECLRGIKAISQFNTGHTSHFGVSRKVQKAAPVRNTFSLSISSHNELNKVCGMPEGLLVGPGLISSEQPYVYSIPLSHLLHVGVPIFYYLSSLHCPERPCLRVSLSASQQFVPRYIPCVSCTYRLIKLENDE